MLPFRGLLLATLLLTSLPVQGEPLVRTPWTTSRIAGSPDPPKPFTTKPVFLPLETKEVLEMIPVPGQERFLVVERGGRVLTFPHRPHAPDLETDLVIDLKALQPQLQSAYGVAFHPRFRETRELFLCYTVGSGLDDGTRLSRFQLESLEPPRADASSEEIVLTWLSGGHNGANLRFGPDGMLYVSAGDATPPSPPDGLNTGQDLGDLLASILRIDVDHRDPGLNYRVPPDNPFLDWPGGRPENWAYGFRNPWKMSFDPVTGDLWCGDVGWELWEMIHLVRKGTNHGWSAVEASQPIRSDTPANPSPITPPVVAHPHTEAASITGGFVYRGSRFPELSGAYVYGDYETGKIWALWHDGLRITRHEEIADTPHRIVTFGEDGQGELFLVHWATPATFHTLARNPVSGQPSAFPRRLSETGLFSDLVRQVPAAGVYPYDVSRPMWQDGATATRFIALPGEAGIDTTLRLRPDGSIAQATVTWPPDAVLARTIRPTEAEAPVETQILHHDGEAWAGYSYRWNEEGTDAILVDAPGDSRLPWPIHGRAECSRCHNTWSGFALGFQPEQLETVSGQPSRSAVVALGLATDDYFERSEAKLAAARSEVELEHQARVWLHANCAHCHRRHGGGSVALMLNLDLTLAGTNLIDEPPLRGDFGLPDARLVVPGDPTRSILLNRLLRHGSGHMPVIGARNPDPEGLRLLWDWIASLPPSEESSPPADDVFPSPLTPRVAMRLVFALEHGNLSESEQQRIVAEALASPDANVRDLFERFRPASDRVAVVGTHPDESALLALVGKVEGGATLLAPDGKLASCLACHFLRGHGRQFGPDLSTVGQRLDKSQILASLLRPSELIDPAFRGLVVETRDDRSWTGFLAHRGADHLLLKLPDGQVTQIPADAVRREIWLPVSLMPEGLIAHLTPQEASDLIAFLAAQTGSPGPP